MVGWLDGWMVGWVDEWMNGWMNGWMTGGVDGWMGGGVDGWIPLRQGFGGQVGWIYELGRTLGLTIIHDSNHPNGLHIARKL